jgi:hypothetical protein
MSKRRSWTGSLVRFDQPALGTQSILSEGRSVPVASPGGGNGVPIRAMQMAVGRSDLQPVADYGRGSKALALAVLADPVMKRQAVAALHRDVYARTAQGPRLAKRGTWEDLAKAAGHPDPFNLSVRLVDEVVGALKAAGYRSVKQYVSIAKQEHIAAKGGLSMDLAIHLTNVTRSSVRGLGPGKHTKALPFRRLEDIPEQEAPIAAGGPLFFRRVCIVGSCWLLREIELAGIRCSHIRLGMESSGFRSPSAM